MTLSHLTQNHSIVALSNPLANADQGLATWFHEHLTPFLVAVLRAICQLGSGEWIGIVLFAGLLFFAWKRLWPSLTTMILAIPCGMLLNELLKVLIQRPRPYTQGEFVDWSGYSFASGHTIGATLLYGQILLFVIPMLKSRASRTLAILSATVVVLLVGFGRIALGAHYFTDVLAAIFFGVLWLTICFFAMKPLHRKVPVPEIIPNVVIAPEPAMALIPVPAAETPEPATVLLR